MKSKSLSLLNTIVVKVFVALVRWSLMVAHMALGKVQRPANSTCVEPFRARAFPVLKDLAVDRSSFDRIIQAGGYISVATGQAQDGNAIPISKEDSSKAFEAAACIGCGACVAACPNGSAMLFTSAKVSHLALLPQGRPEAAKRVQAMVAQHDLEGFGMCSNIGACEAECPKGISIDNIARMNREFTSASFTSQPEKAEVGGM
jgi:succinate dehydrogenase / fumarate reductase, iron-sulfur subunit